MPVGAVIGAGALGAGATVLASSNASKAAQKAGDLQYQASQDQIALQQRIYDQTRADNAPFRDIGLSAAQALASGYGLPVSMTAGSSAPANSNPAPGVSMTGGTKTYGGSAGVSPLEGASASAPASAGTPDWAAYGADNPDVAAEWQRIVATGNAGNDKFQNDPNAYYQWHYDTYGQNEGRAVPTTAPTPTSQPAPQAQAPSMTGGAPAGYADPTAQNGYSVGARPTPGPTPTYTAAQPLDVSASSYQSSPGFQFQLDQAKRALDNTSSSMGGVMSGARVKAAMGYATGLANQDYTDWRNYTTQQYDTNRAFDYGAYRDQVGDYNTNRARSDGLYQDDRSYAAGRYDTRNNQLLTLAGFGTGANSANQNAAQSFATNAGNGLMTGAQAQGNAAINSANAWTSGVNNLMTTGAYLGGRYLGGNAGGGSGGSYYGGSPFGFNMAGLY